MNQICSRRAFKLLAALLFSGLLSGVARAQAPTLSASCGRTRITTGLLPIGWRSAPPSRPVTMASSVHSGLGP